MIIIFAIAIVLAPFALVVFRGAPYLPTHHAQIDIALDLLDLKEGELLVELGSGDGVVLKAAAQRGWRCVGYELNPILVLVSRLRCWRYRDRVEVRMGDFWRKPLPIDTQGIFVFLLDRYMYRLGKRIEHELPDKPVRLASYIFQVPGKKPEKEKAGVFLYLFN